MIKKTIEKYIAVYNKLFDELLNNLFIFKFGNENLDVIDKSTVISPTISIDIELEPIPITKIIALRKEYPHFILDVYHNKFVIEWQNMLDDIFVLVVEEHFAGRRNFAELGRVNLKVDFNESKSIPDQIYESVCTYFSFLEYKERYRIINKVFSSAQPIESHRINIYKNILIRNAIQHRNRVVDEYFLRSLGLSNIRILDPEGNPTIIEAGGKVDIHLPELYEFKKSISYIINKWIQNAEI